MPIFRVIEYTVNNTREGVGFQLLHAAAAVIAAINSCETYQENKNFIMHLACWCANVG